MKALTLTLPVSLFQHLGRVSHINRVRSLDRVRVEKTYLTLPLPLTSISTPGL